MKSPLTTILILSSALCAVGSLAGDSGAETALREKESQVYAYLTGETEGRALHHIENYFAATELVDELEDTAVVLYGEDSLELAPWLYLSAMNRYQFIGILESDDRRASYRAVIKMANISGKKLYTTSLGFGSPLNSGWGSAESARSLARYFGQEAIRKTSDLVAIFEKSNDLQGQAMALIYRADFQLLMNSGTPFDNYRKAQGLLREAGVTEDRINLFFSSPQLVPANRFFATLEEAIANQEAELAARISDHDDAARLAPYFAWDESVPAVRAPVFSVVLQADAPSYQYVDLRFRIDSRGRTGAINVVAAESEDSRSRTIARKAADKLHFRPALENGRGQPQSGLHMRFHLPGSAD